MYWISDPAAANPQSGHFRKSGQVRLRPNFWPDLPDVGAAAVATVHSFNYG